MDLPEKFGSNEFIKGSGWCFTGFSGSDAASLLIDIWEAVRFSDPTTLLAPKRFGDGAYRIVA